MKTTTTRMIMTLTAEDDYAKNFAAEVLKRMAAVQDTTDTRAGDGLMYF